MTPKLITFYTQILGMCGIKPNKNGFCNISWQGTEVPCVIDQKTLCLPTKERLEAFDFQANIIFHPMSEVPHRGESEVLERIRKCFIEKMDNTIKIVMMGLLDIAANPSKQKDLDPEQLQLLKAVPGVTQECFTYFREKIVIASIKSPALMKFYGLNLRKSGRYKGKNVGTIGISFFPFYEGLKAGKPEKAKPAYLQAYQKTLEYIFQLDDEEAYNRPAVSQLFAPMLTSFILSAGAVADSLNNVMKLFGTQIFSNDEELQSYLFEMDWADMMTDIEQLIPDVKSLPVQTGNGGRVEPRQVKEESIPKLPLQQHNVTLQAQQPEVAPQPQIQQPVVQMQAPSLFGGLGGLGGQTPQTRPGASPLEASLGSLPGNGVTIAGFGSLGGIAPAVVRREYVPSWAQPKQSAVSSGIPPWL